jgi:hypothetical protein
LAGRPAPAAQHGRGGDQHEPGEQAEQQAGADARGQPGASVGAGHAQDADGNTRREADLAGLPVRDHPGCRRDPRNEQRPGCGRMRRLVQQVDQDRDGEDGPSAAEGAERQARPAAA